MKVLVLNPNTTQAMTALVTAALQRHLGPRFELHALTARQGDAVIATDEAFDAAAGSALGLLREAAALPGAFDAVVLACFGDPGLEALREHAGMPVIGLAHAAMRQAERLGAPYAIVTAGAAWDGLLSRRLRDWNASPLFTGVQVIEGTGLGVLHDPDGSVPRVARAMARARDAGAHHIILGGAVFAGYAAVLQRHGLPVHGVLDGVQAAAAELKPAQD